MLLFGMAIGHRQLVNFEFDLSKPYAGCRLCGQLYQSDLDRSLWGVDTEARLLRAQALALRQEWRERHTRLRHTEHEVEMLKMSGLMMTPEAAHRLAPFGIIPVSDAVKSDEVWHALFEAPRAPIDDVEGV